MILKEGTSIFFFKLLHWMVDGWSLVVRMHGVFSAYTEALLHPQAHPSTSPAGET